MADDHASGGASAAFRCPWCSAALPSIDLDICPSCGATLTSAPDAALPGVTAIDHEAIMRATREPPRQQRSRILSWLSGDYIEEGGPTEGVATDAIAPPDAAVKREILRLEIEAEMADRQAEADAIAADAAVEGRPIPGTEDEETAPTAEELDDARTGNVADADEGVAATSAEVEPEAERRGA